jgi:hypothetical protein
VIIGETGRTRRGDAVVEDGEELRNWRRRDSTEQKISNSGLVVDTEWCLTSPNANGTGAEVHVAGTIGGREVGVERGIIGVTIITLIGSATRTIEVKGQGTIETIEGDRKF